MMDYTKLIEALRYCVDSGGMVNCNTICKYGWEDSHGCKGILMNAAADAIEALQEYLAASNDEVNHLAESNKELQAELNEQTPKRGEWIHVEGDEPWEWRCTACHKIAEGLGEFRFCPNCGAKMEGVQG